MHLNSSLNLTCESELIALATRLGARTVSGWSEAEESLSQSSLSVSDEIVEQTRSKILDGHDPLGDAFSIIRTPQQRRGKGATLTPLSIVSAMLTLSHNDEAPQRIVDPGAGSGRFLVEAGKLHPDAKLIGIELDPLPALLARANLAVHGFAKRSRISVADYREYHLEKIPARTLFIGNPPYVRHHELGPKWKHWLSDQAQLLNLSASQLAGLHVYFYLATLLNAKSGDRGCFITASEWLNVNYGKFLRELFLERLGGERVILIDPSAMPFPDAATTAAITQFEVGSRTREIVFNLTDNISEIAATHDDRIIPKKQLENEQRWSRFIRPPETTDQELIELGELCRVHRGQVTGANHIWVTDSESVDLPSCVLFRSVTKAQELIRAGEILDDTSRLRSVIDIPIELDEFDSEERRRVDRFLARVKRQGTHLGYIASHRRAWWSVGLRDPAPILATYMARRPPVFVLNQGAARHINIAHGLYPRITMTTLMLSRLATYLSQSVKMSSGRTYAGGLTKFEPKEMERLRVPRPEMLMKDEEWRVEKSST